MSPDDDARPPRLVQIAVAAAAGLLIYLLVYLMTRESITAGTFGFAAAQLAAELAAPNDDDPPDDGGSTAGEISPDDPLGGGSTSHESVTSAR